MPQSDGRDAASVIRGLSMRSHSTRAVKLGMMRGGMPWPVGPRRIAHMHAAVRRRTRVGRMGPDDMRRMENAGLIRYSGDGTPAVTRVGRWSATASGLGISFLEMCVLAKVYDVARSMEGARGGGGAGGSPARTVTIPLKTVQYFFEDWPIYPGRIQHALSRLRGRGLIPRSRPRRVTCDMSRLGAMRAELSEIGRWVDDTGEEIRRVLLHGY